MRYPIYLLLCLLALTAQSQSIKKLHYKAILVDTHNDVLSSSVLEGLDISNRLNKGQSDFVRWKEGGVDVQFFSVWTGEQGKKQGRFL